MVVPPLTRLAPAALQAADQICVLEAGRVVEMGTHAELSAKPEGDYTRLVNSQSLSLSR